MTPVSIVLDRVSLRTSSSPDAEVLGIWGSRSLARVVDVPGRRA